MRTLNRSTRNACTLLALAGLGGFACVRDPMGIVGVSPPQSTLPVDAASEDAVPHALTDGIHLMLRAIGSARPSVGHGGGFDADVYANEGARQSWATHEDMPDGAILAEELFEQRGANSRALGIYVMTKDGGQWQFSVERGSGAPSNTQLCVLCHREAPRDSVFSLAVSVVDNSRPPKPPAAPAGDASADSANESVQGLSGRAAGANANVVDAAAESRGRSDSDE